jgi:hypothetical protein
MNVQGIFCLSCQTLLWVQNSILHEHKQKDPSVVG